MPQSNQPCNQLEDKIADFVTGHVSSSARAEVQSHLDACANCRRLVYSQKAVRRQLQLLAQRDKHVAPPAFLWERAAAIRDAQDARQRRGGQLRWMVAGASMLVLLLSVVWADLASGHEFPVEAVMQDFRAVRKAAPSPHFITSDADKAAVWLRERLNADMPPLNLSLSRAELLGADVIALPEPVNQNVGRLLYRVPQGILAVYVAPGGSHFARTTPLLIEDHDFQVKTSAADIGLYGWETRDVGYGLLMAQPIADARGLAVNAEHASEQSRRSEQ